MTRKVRFKKDKLPPILCKLCRSRKERQHKGTKTPYIEHKISCPLMRAGSTESS